MAERPPVMDGRQKDPPDHSSSSFARWLVLGAVAGVALHGLWRASIWGPFEPRVLEVAREQYAAGHLLRVPTFGGMPFLEKPALFFDLVALAFHLAGGPHVIAARVVTGVMALLWLAACWALARRAGGPRAGLLAGALLAATPLFFRLARKVELDIALAAFLSGALYFLARFLQSDDRPIRRRMWWACLACVALAALTKGLLGTFLFLAPVLVFGLVTLDRRLLRQLVRPATIVWLVAPHILWGWVLYRGGGSTYLLDHFINNSIGRFLHLRFEGQGVARLPYGDVGGTSPWFYYITRIHILAGPAILVGGAALYASTRGRLRMTRGRGSPALLALCWGLVPLVALSFSGQKGIHHLGSCTTGLVVAAALWANDRVKDDPGRGGVWWPSLCWSLGSIGVPALVVAGFFGWPGTMEDVRLAGGGIGAVCLAGLVGLLWERRFGDGLVCLCTLAMAVWVLDLAPARVERDDAGRPRLVVGRWLASELDFGRIGVFGYGDSDLGIMAFLLGRTVVPLSAERSAAEFLAAPGPALCVNYSRDRDRQMGRLVTNGKAFEFARVALDSYFCAVYVNARARTRRARPRSSVPREPP